MSAIYYIETAVKELFLFTKDYNIVVGNIFL